MEMGKEIRRLRNARGLTQEALAAALNVTAQTVSKWECGNSIPDVQLLPEIAVYFGVSIDQLFAMSPEQQMERIENHIYDRGMFTEAEERQLEQQLGVFAEDPALEGRAKLLLTKLYNNQAEQYRLLAVEMGKEAVEKTGGGHDAVSELANAWGSYMPDWNVRNHHALIDWFSDYCRRHPDNRAALMWLLDNLIDDRRLAEAREWLVGRQRLYYWHVFTRSIHDHIDATACHRRTACQIQRRMPETQPDVERTDGGRGIRAHQSVPRRPATTGSH